LLVNRARLAVVSMHTSPTAALGVSANGGMNVYVQQVCQAFSRCGIATDVFTLRRDADDPEQEPMAPLSRVVYVPTSAPVGDKYSLLGSVEAFADGVLAFAATEGLDYDLIYSHYWLSGLVADSLAGELGLSWAHTAHTLGLIKNRTLAPGARPEPEQRLRAEESIARSADLLVASTAAEAEELVSLLGADPDSVAVVAPGVDLSLFRPRNRAAAKRRIGYAGVPLLIFVGRLERLKGVEIILRALAAVRSRFPEVRLLVLGEDSRDAVEGEKERLRALAAEIGVGDQVDFLGSVAHHELAHFYAAADACLMPSYSESFGLVGLEAQACGCPVIASNVAGLASVVRDGVTGYLVDEPDPGAYALRIQTLLGDPELADQMGRRGILLAQRFPWAHTADRIWAAMEPLLRSAGREAATTPSL
jgi:D-inositol-3-phosphate glycosyltransferase